MEKRGVVKVVAEARGISNEHSKSEENAADHTTFCHDMPFHATALPNHAHLSKYTALLAFINSESGF